MQPYIINSPCVIFNHSEYGQRLLFRQAATNPRNELGKNGVTLHNGFSALFYRTIDIQVTLIDEEGEHENTTLSINRNSLIKYMGENASSYDSDEQLIEKFNASLWTSDLNHPAKAEDRQQQIAVGEHSLRHAGQHNQSFLSHWATAIYDFFRGNFLSWLYQVTIAKLESLPWRFVFVNTEKDLFDAGELLAKKRCLEAYRDVPAYHTHITRFNGQPIGDTTLMQIPVTNKDNYIKAQEHDSDTHVHGKYPKRSKTDTSTGTTGKPTAWVRSEQELETVKHSLQIAAQIQFGDRALHYINAFALGPWATGLSTYELMRNTGSVFATGPDKEKILDELLRICKYEKHQIALAIETIDTPLDKKIMQDLIANTVKAVLKNKTLAIEDALDAEIDKIADEHHAYLNAIKSELLAIAQTSNKEKAQLIIAGYPPFLKDLANYIHEQGHDLHDFSLVGIVGGQAISEAMRDQLLKQGFNNIYSSYGASDLDINLGVETDYEISVRITIEQNPGLARELYGENKGLPMVFHYDPMNYHVECEANNDLLFTCTREDRSSPRIRYNLGDKGRVYASSDVQALLSKYGMFQKPKSNLPLMFVWGRESTVIFNGANLAFTELERAITDIDVHDTILKKAFYTYEDQEGEHLEIWLELNDGIELPLPEAMNNQAQTLIAKLASLNQDFRYQVEKLDAGAPLPVVRFYKRHESPISEAGGHRKQVLIFQKDVNLEKNYEFPDATKCYAATTTMAPDLLATAAPPALRA